MKRLILATAGLLLVASSAYAATDADCGVMFRQADTNSDGTLNAVESERYAAMLRMADKIVAADSDMTEASFLESCKADVFANATIDPKAPLEGANSFTESQAKDRVLAIGLTAPSTLTKDDKGIWRGTAMKSGMSVSVAVDFKGNVVAQ